MASSTGPLSRSREAFAETVSNWMAKESITMKMIHTWATDTKSSGPWNSQMHGVLKKALEPKPALFESLGAMNKAIATDDVPLGINPHVREVFRKAKPMIDIDGKLMDAGGFFALFVGSKEPNSIYLETNRYTNEEAEILARFLRLLFQEVAKKRFQDRQEAWAELEPLIERNMKAFEADVGPFETDMRARMHDVLAGWNTLKGAEVSVLCGDYEQTYNKDCPIKQAFEEYSGIHLGDAHDLAKMEWPAIQEWVSKETAAIA